MKDETREMKLGKELTDKRRYGNSIIYEKK